MTETNGKTDRADQREATPLPAELLAILVCPVDKTPVRQEGDQLRCPHCGRSYPIENGIPNMLVDMASQP